MDLHRTLCSLALLAVLVSTFDEIETKPLLTIKLAGSYRTRSFIDGAWTEPTEFDESPLADILALCNSDKYWCMGHNFGKISMSHAIFITTYSTFGDGYFCATSWPRFDSICLRNAMTPGECARKLPYATQESFLCVETLSFNVAMLMKMHTSTEYTDKEELSGGFTDVEDALPGFFNNTGLFATFTFPGKEAAADDSTTYKEFSYLHFADSTSSHVVARACTKTSILPENALYRLDEPTVFNVNKSLHPVLGNWHEDDCIDNTKLAYSLPLKNQRDGYYVCHGDIPRNMVGRKRGGGLYCWVDKQLNLDLRCNSVLDATWLEDGTVARVDQYEEYADWLSECPEDLRYAVLAATKAKFKKEQKEKMLREVDEL